MYTFLQSSAGSGNYCVIDTWDAINNVAFVWSLQVHEPIENRMHACLVIGDSFQRREPRPFSQVKVSHSATD